MLWYFSCCFVLLLFDWLSLSLFEKDSYLTDQNRSLHITLCSAQISHYLIPIGRDGTLLSESLEHTRAIADLSACSSLCFGSSEPKLHAAALSLEARSVDSSGVSITFVVPFLFPLSLVCLNVLESPVFKRKYKKFTLNREFENRFRANALRCTLNTTLLHLKINYTAFFLGNHMVF